MRAKRVRELFSIIAAAVALLAVIFIVATVLFVRQFGYDSYVIDKTACAVGGQRFTIWLKSPLDPVKEQLVDVYDLSHLAITQGRNGNPIQIDLYPESGSADATIFETVLTHDVSICEATTALALDKTTALLLFSSDHRPYGTKLTTVAYDVRNHQILDIKIDIAFEGVSPAVQDWEQYEEPLIPITNGFTFLSSNHPTDSIRCETDCGVIHGRTVNSIDDWALPVWMSVIYESDKIESGVIPERSWQTSPVRSFFTDQAAFDKAFQYGKNDKSYAIQWYRLAHLENGTQCLYPSIDRGLPKQESDWICS